MTPTSTTHRLLRPGAPPIALQPGVTFTFGRLPTCSLPIDAPSVSRLHAAIEWRAGRPALVDRSSFGTLVGGQPVKERALEPGDVIQVGPFRCTYDAGEQAAAGGLQGATVAGEGEVLSGAIDRAGGLGECLQSLELSGRTGTLVVFGFGQGKHGRVTLRDGTPMTADCEGLLDDEAILAMLGLERGRFSFLPEPGLAARRVRRSITGLLLEAGRRLDEGASRSQAGTRAPPG